MDVQTNSFDRVFNKLIDLDGEMRAKIARRSSPLDDLVYMGMLLRANKVHNVVEIGTFLGQSACFLAPCITGTFYTINVNPREVVIARETVAQFGVKNVKFITGDSLAVLPDVMEEAAEGLGAVYIDGYHSYEYAMGEYKIAEPYVEKSPSAAVFFDDAAKLHPDGANDGGVLRAVEETGSTPIAMLGNRVAIKTFGSFRYV